MRIEKCEKCAAEGKKTDLINARAFDIHYVRPDKCMLSEKKKTNATNCGVCRLDDVTTQTEQSIFVDVAGMASKSIFQKAIT